MEKLKEKLKAAIENIAVRASDASSSDDAMKFTQAACNASNALRVIIDCEKAIEE